MKDDLNRLVDYKGLCTTPQPFPDRIWVDAEDAWNVHHEIGSMRYVREDLVPRWKDILFYRGEPNVIFGWLSHQGHWSESLTQEGASHFMIKPPPPTKVTT